MPQASQELREEWMADGIASDEKAMQYLKAAGYRLTRQWFWIKPTPAHSPTDKEWSAICFLVDEWDFGGIVN